MIEAHTKLLRHVINCDCRLPVECANRVLVGSSVRELHFHSYDPVQGTFSNNVHSALFQHAADYFNEFGIAPSDDAILMELQLNDSIDAKQKRQFNELLLQIRQYDANPSETPLLVALVMEEFRRNRHTYIMQKSVKIRESAGIDASIKFAQDQLAVLTASSGADQKKGAYSGSQFADEVIEQMKAGAELVPTVGKYGLRKLDAFTGGLYEGNVVVFAAGLSSGKSWCLHEVALFNAIDLGKRVVIWNLEMLEKQIAQRIMCRQTKIPYNRLRKGYGNLTPDEQDLFDIAQQGIRDLGERVLFLGKDRCANFSQVQAEMNNHFGTVPVDICSCDYLDLVQVSKGKWNAPHEKVAMASAEARDFAGRNRLCVVTATQFNRQGNKKVTGTADDLSNLQVAKDADTGIALWADPNNTYNPPEGDDETPGEPGVILMKVFRGRSHGSQGKDSEPFRLNFEPSTGTISDASDFTRSPVSRAFADRHSRQAA